MCKRFFFNSNFDKAVINKIHKKRNFLSKNWNFFRPTASSLFYCWDM